MTTSVLRMYHACLEVGGRNPSAYNLGGEDDAWSANDPNIYAEPAQPIRVAMELFAQGKARLRLRGA